MADIAFTKSTRNKFYEALNTSVSARETESERDNMRGRERKRERVCESVLELVGVRKSESV